MIAMRAFDFRWVCYGIIAITLAWSLALIVTPVEAEIRRPPLAQFPWCAQEDGAGQGICYWDADTQGNGTGTDVLHGYRVLDCGPRWHLLVEAGPMWDEGCQRDDRNRPIALRVESTIRVMR